jgi:pSer/pThr/pTyr-binding forkhead associated (FHA) protein
MPKISVLYPEMDKQIAQVPETGLLIGRGTACGLQLTDEFVSAKHCRVFLENENLFIEDFGSTNGTFIDGTEVQKKSLLKTGQNIQLGITVLKAEN